MAYDPANPYADRAPNGGSPYNAMRAKATQDAGNAGAQGLDAITRRYSAMGNLNSGSYIKAIEENSRTAAQGAQDSQAKIDMSENQNSLPFIQQQRELGQQESQFSRELPMKQRQLDLEASQQGMDQAANQFNQQMASYQANHSGGLMGQGGLLGMGNNGQWAGWQNFGDMKNSNSGPAALFGGGSL